MNSTEEISYPEYQISTTMGRVWTTAILLVGGFGNIATIFVMRRINVKGNNCSQQVILQALAVVDFSLLYLGASRFWMIDFFDIDVRNVHTAVCKAHLWLVYSLGTVSAWLVTVVTVQRAIAVKWPHRLRATCTVRRTRIAVAVIICASGLIQVHFVLGMGVIDGDCLPLSTWYDNVSSGFLNWVEMAVASIMPSLCLFVCDIVLISTLHQTRSTSSMSIYSISNTTTRRNNRQRKRRISKTTAMILVLSVTFLLLTLPVCVYFLWEHYSWDQLMEDPQMMAKADLAFAVALQLWYTNSAVNFLLYCITGTRFRREFYDWICCRPTSERFKSFRTSSTGRGSVQREQSTSVET